MTLPPEFAVRLNRHTRLVDGGRVLLGGSPTRLVHLAPKARPLLKDRTVRADTPAGAVLADRLLDLAMADPVTEELPEPDAEYSVVIPVMDRPAELARLLASIEASAPAGHAPPVIVVDDGSRAPEDIAGVAARHGARLVALPENVGPGGARNAGLREVTTPFVVFADSDIVLNPRTVPTLLKHFADPKVGMAAPRIVGLKGQRTWIARYEDARSSLDLGDDPAAVKPRSPVAWASTACVVARVAAVGEGFDDAMRVGEDVDLGWRLVDAGWRVRYEPAAQAEHEHRAAFGDWIARKAVYGTGAHPLSQRHPDAIAPAVLSPWSAGLVLALMAQRRWSVPAAFVIYGVTSVRIARKLRRTDHPYVLGAWLTANGVVSAGAQASALALRHWWPLAAAGCLVSRRMRRIVAVAAVADIALEYRRNPAQLDVLRFGLAKRLDDLAYGAGVWFAALRARSWASLKPDIRGRRG
ncbi:putative glycosyltransferase [Sinomonas cyclohexanicum]|uniref:Glycosyltransferase n=1 Tax=Sinomonas cyclohexanicum TaxID=322009 RepID=A0ABM7PSB9_SINCY|nr:mycofactocin biosynthesis glycosyltransferase MftF [Corynebacterium cyclohexanicum]BCT75111.1 putative glycosyltransferase [Corynebacterium cyclohexanicum]